MSLSDALIRTSTANHARGQRKPDARVQHAGLLASRATDVICCMKTRDARRAEQEPCVFELRALAIGQNWLAGQAGPFNQGSFNEENSVVIIIRFVRPDQSFLNCIHYTDGIFIKTLGKSLVWRSVPTKCSKITNHSWTKRKAEI